MCLFKLLAISQSKKHSDMPSSEKFEGSGLAIIQFMTPEAVAFCAREKFSTHVPLQLASGAILSLVASQIL